MKNKRLTVTRPDKCSTNSAGLSGRQDVQEFGKVKWLEKTCKYFNQPATEKDIQAFFIVQSIATVILLLVALSAWLQ